MSDQRGWPVPVSARFDGPAGAPVLVLGNSIGTSSAVWDRQVPELSRRFRLLRFELPGHGGAPAWPGPYTIAELGGGVLALLDAHGIERAAFAGTSMGGMIGMWLAAAAPERITALGLVCTSAYLPPAAAYRDRAQLVRAEGMGPVARPAVGRWFTADFAAREPAVVDAARAGFEQTDPEGYAGCCEAIAAMDLRGDLKAIRAPTLVVAGQDDPATPPAHSAVIADGIPAARLLVLRHAAHLAVISSAAEVASALVAHFGRAAAADESWAR